NNLRSHQCVDSSILVYIVVVTDKDTNAKPLRRVEHGVFRSALDQRMLERLELAMPVRLAIGHRHDIAVMKMSLLSGIDQPNADDDPIFLRQSTQPPRTFPFKNR